MTAWISMITDEQADENLLDALQLARTPHGTVDNVMRVHSHRPNTQCVVTLPYTGRLCMMKVIAFRNGCRRPYRPMFPY